MFCTFHSRRDIRVFRDRLFGQQQTFCWVMCLEIMAMEGHCEKEMSTTSVNKKRWSKSKRRTFLRTHKGKASARTFGAFSERRQRIRAWPARKFQLKSVDISGNQLSVPSGAMAPKNTTQYLMDLVYTEQLEVSMESYDVRPVFSMQSHVPHEENVFSSSDFDYDRSLDFQQRDFENVFFRNEI